MPKRLAPAFCGALLLLSPVPAFADDPFLPLTARHSGKGLGFGGFQTGHPPGRGVPSGNNQNRQRGAQAMLVLSEIFSITTTGATN